MCAYNWEEFSLLLNEKSSLSDFSGSLTGVAVDSRDVKPGNVFFALDGARTDGHLFLEEVSKKGAAAAVVKKTYSGPKFGLVLFYVDDPLVSLQNAAKRWLAKSPAKVVAVTGSLGKTSTKGFLFSILKAKFNVSTTSGSKNSQIGLALAILNETRGDEDYLVLEMGMSAAGHIKKLVDIAPPHLALITSIELVHSENFDAIEDIAKAKAEIFSHPKTEKVIINQDSNCASDLLNLVPCEKESYSLRGDARAKWTMNVTANGMEFCENGEKVVFPFLNLQAEHMYMNLLAAVGCARSLGMSFAEIQGALGEVCLPEKRLQEIEKKGVVFINDAYNAAEASMKGALDVIRKRNSGNRKIAILGHMRELGKFSDGCHRRVGEFALSCVDTVICLGENCKPLVEAWQEANKPVHWFLQFDEMMQHIHKEIRPGDLVLVKGARSLQLEKIIESF